MTIEGSALTALFIGIVWALIKVVYFFIDKYKDKKETQKEALSQEQANQLFEIYKMLLEIKNKGTLSEDQSEALDTIEMMVLELHRLHDVYDSNHVPLWYVPTEMIGLIREVHVSLQALNKEIEDNLGDVKNGQSLLVSKITDLISSNKIMTERIGDLISALGKFPKGGSE